MIHRPKIKPKILKWARERMRLSEEELAAKIGLKDNVDRYQRYESEDDTLTPAQGQLHEIARVLNRPVWFFFLDDPPDDEPEPSAQFRVRDRAEPEITYPEIRTVLEMERRRDATLDALVSIGESIPRFNIAATLIDDPERVSVRVRTELGVHIVRQLSWDTSAYPYWREAVESAGVLVFHSNLPRRSGFALVRDPLPIVCISTHEVTSTAKTFTLMHELGHVVLGDTTMHDLTPFIEHHDRIERWCNKFAASLLVPEAELKEMEEVRRYGMHGYWGADDVVRVANNLKVSPQMLVYRLANFDLIDEHVAENLAQLFKQRSEAIRKERERKIEEDKKRGVKKPVYFSKTLGSWGYYFPNAVFKSYHNGGFSEIDVVRSLGISPQTVNKFERRLNDRKYAAI